MEIATKCGADVVLNPSKCDVVKEVKALTESYGCNVYIEATGHPESVKQGYIVDYNSYYLMLRYVQCTQWNLGPSLLSFVELERLSLIEMILNRCIHKGILLDCPSLRDL